MKKTIIIAAALVAMTACNKSIIETSVAETGYGYISLGVTADTEMVVTKGITTTADLEGYTITLENTDTQETVWSVVYDGTNIAADAWKQPAGNYKVTVFDLAHKDEADAVAEVYELNEGKGDKYIYGEGTVTVVAGDTKPCTVDCTVQNSKVTFASDALFRDVFTAASVTVAEKEGSRSKKLTVGDDHVEGDAVYFEPVALTWTLDATTALDGQTRRYTGEFTAQKGKYTQVTFSTGNTDGQISVTITVDSEMETVTLEPVQVDPFEGEVVTPQA